jgi:abortive infection bacteriophage resistance protein
MEYSKPPISLDEQIKKLSDRGLIIDSPAKAKETLSNISYYRLRAYTYPFQDNSNPNHPFIFSVSFDDIIALYEFDHKLRLLVFDALEKIEIALRTKIIYYMSMSYKGSWFENSSLFRNHFRFVKDSEKLNKEIHRSQETFIKHYKTKYSNPANPPAWMSLEVTSMGLLSKFFENIKMCPEKKIIAKEFGLKNPKILESWMHTFTNLRNICAHHGRLWNRRFTTVPAMPRNTVYAFIEETSKKKNKIYNVICCIHYLLNIIKPHFDLPTKLKTLFDTTHLITLSEMGFPENWEKEKFWE